MSRDTIELTYENEDGDEVVLTLSSKMEVCPDCEGHGWVLNEAMREHAYTPEEFAEEFDDEGREQYFKRGGIYDVRCSTCKGENVVPVVDESKLNEEQKKQYEEYQEYEERIAQGRAEDAAYSRMERMMGC